MMDDDTADDALRGIDLGAWAPPPPPPPGPLADAVVARLREPAPVSAHEPAGRGARRRWPIATAAVVAVAAGVLAIAWWGTERPPAAGHGEVFAARAAHLELGPSSAELDPGAEVRWRRGGRRIEAAQPRGSVLWRAGTGDTIVIDAGAAVASVEASGASLRVEVQMNMSDAKVIGASAVTAVAVALVTVIVYQGHVKVTSAGQTVTVEPGSLVEVRPREAARDALAVGAATPSVDQMRREVRVLQQRILEAEQARAAREAAPEDAPARTPARRAPPPPRSSCDADALAERGMDMNAAGQLAAALDAFEQAYACKPEAQYTEKAFIVACNLESVPKARSFWKRLTPMMRQRALMICVRNGISEEMLDE